MPIDATLKNRKPELDGHIEVSRLPRKPGNGQSYWLNGNGSSELTHGLFKFPAKFHVPIVQWALGTFGRRGSSVLDPFTGSGTVQVEAKRRGIASYGLDVDPLSVAVSKAKTTPIDPQVLREETLDLVEHLKELRNVRGAVQDQPGRDISRSAYAEESAGLDIPPIPNIEHWFRRYVIVDLAKAKALVAERRYSRDVVTFLMVCFGGIIRRVSNADPAPVSGLEVTSYQIEKNKERTISVFDEFEKKLVAETDRMTAYWDELGPDNRNVEALVEQADATNLSTVIDPPGSGFPLVVTSPPYCRAVEYGRRHRLEHFWLDFVESGPGHVELVHRYIGRDYVRVGDWDDSEQFGVAKLDQNLADLRKRDHHRRRTVHHYFSQMAVVLEEIRSVMKRSGTLVLVVGDSVCAGQALETGDYLADLASEHFSLQYRFKYEIRNHHMQYGLWNGDGIKEEHVIVLKP